MAGLQQWIIGLISIALISVAIIMYAINFASDNDAVVDISDDSEISNLLSQQQENLSSFSGASESTYASIANSSVSSGSQTTTTAGAFTITPPTAVGTIKNIFLAGYVKLFGTDSGFGIFLSTFFSILSMITIFMIWKAWVGGQPN